MEATEVAGRMTRKRLYSIAAVAVVMVLAVTVVSGVTPLYHRGFVGLGGDVISVGVTIVYKGNDSGYLNYEGLGSYSFQALSNGSVSKFALLFYSTVNASHWISKIYTTSSGIKISSISQNPPFSFTNGFTVNVISYSSSENMWRSIPSLVIYTT